MAKPKVYVTYPLAEEVLALLKNRCEVEMNPENQVLSTSELLTKIKGRDAVLVVSASITEEICQAAKIQCKIFANYGVGYNNIDVSAATKHGIFVSNTPDVLTDAAADHTFALLIAAARRIVECDAFVRSGQKGWGPMNLIGSHVSGKTLGIIGGGRIGKAMAQRAKGFNMKIIYTDIQRNQDFETDTGGKFVEKDTLLRQSDFVSLHVPFLPSTRHLISTSELNHMKKTAILINASRGPVVDEKALVAGLRAGLIGGAGLDVFECEPELEPGLAELTNVVLTPHVATSTIDTRIAMGELCAQNIFAVMDGQIPPTCLNPEAQAIPR
jgi:glyoxylate reductase